MTGINKQKRSRTTTTSRLIAVLERNAKLATGELRERLLAAIARLKGKA
jgi:hypothetical protein